MLLYRLILTLVAPLLAAGLVLRLLRRQESLRDLGQRLGGGEGVGRPGAIWLHGASNGELASAKALVQALIAAFPNRALVISCNTLSGRDLVRDWQLDAVHARLAPLDYRLVLARFRARWRPTVLIVLENELWPNRIATSPAPVICVAARMSARSAAGWARLGRLPRRVLGRVRMLWPQDAASAGRFEDLGLPKARIAPVATLKSGVTLAPPPADLLAQLRALFKRSSTILAASTHAGEDAILLDGFNAARAANPALRLILAPRHPRRSAEIVQLLQSHGLPHAVRSRGDTPDADCIVYLADTLGEMALWFALCGISFVGGSLVPRGGHTPYEPAQAGSAILHGPHVANFTEIYAALDANGGARQIADAEGLTAALTALSDARAQDDMARRASAVLAAQDSGAVLIGDVVAQVRGLIS